MIKNLEQRKLILSNRPNGFCAEIKYRNSLKKVPIHSMFSGKYLKLQSNNDIDRLIVSDDNKSTVLCYQKINNINRRIMSVYFLLVT